MKRILALAVCLGLAVPLLAHADPDKDKAAKKEQKAAQRAAKAQQKAVRKETRENVQQAQRRSVETRRNRAEVQQARIETNRTRVGTAANVRQSTTVTDANRTRTAARRDWKTRRGPRDHAWTYDEARRYHRRDRRDRSWWRSNYTRFAIFGGGYYYWDRGYWYPAYGYDPAYSTYIYDEPIYGYNQLEPRNVLVNVQTELSRMGYYRGAIDGLIGPMTRSALTRFQADNRLPVTSRIDGPTLAALGLV